MRGLLYYLYGRLLLRQVRGRDVPRHLGIILDGNRRYALERGVPDTSRRRLAPGRVPGSRANC